MKLKIELLSVFVLFISFIGTFTDNMFVRAIANRSSRVGMRMMTGSTLLFDANTRLEELEKKRQELVDNYKSREPESYKQVLAKKDRMSGVAGFVTGLGGAVMGGLTGLAMGTLSVPFAFGLKSELLFCATPVIMGGLGIAGAVSGYKSGNDLTHGIVGGIFSSKKVEDGKSFAWFEQERQEYESALKDIDDMIDNAREEINKLENIDNLSHQQSKL